MTRDNGEKETMAKDRDCLGKRDKGVTMVKGAKPRLGSNERAHRAHEGEGL